MERSSLGVNRSPGEYLSRSPLACYQSQTNLRQFPQRIHPSSAQNTNIWNYPFKSPFGTSSRPLPHGADRIRGGQARQFLRAHYQLPGGRRSTPPAPQAGRALPLQRAVFQHGPSARKKKTRDWVVLYFDGQDGERQCTVITSEFGRLKDKRIVRGREDECEEHYRNLGQLPPRHLHLVSSLPED